MGIKSRRIDCVGEKFGRLLVIARSPEMIRNGSTVWTCWCDCGNFIDVTRHHLIQGQILSCGCYHREVSRNICLVRNRHLGFKNRKYPFNENIFDSWTKESAYLLGWIVTDGYVAKDQVEFRQKDWEACEILRRIIDHSQAPWKDYGSELKWRVTFCSVYLVNRLLELGISSPKTFTLSLPSIPEEFLSHFTRGVVDGDGCIHLRKNGRLDAFICSASRRFIDQLSSSIPIHGCITIGKPKYTHYSQVYRLTFNGSFAHKFCSWIYKDSESLRLTRKYQKYEKAKEYY